MWKILKYLFFNPKQNDRIIIVQQNDEHAHHPLELQPFSPWVTAGWLLVVLLVFSAGLMFMTPLGNLYQSAQTREIRADLQEMNQRALALADSMRARDLQLEMLQRVMLGDSEGLLQSELVEGTSAGFTNSETGAFVFDAQQRINGGRSGVGTLRDSWSDGNEPENQKTSSSSSTDGPAQPGESELTASSEKTTPSSNRRMQSPQFIDGESFWDSFDQLSNRSITHSGFDTSNESNPFQNPFVPIDGIVSRGFNPEKKHFGIDFATAENTPFYAVEEGVIVSSNWTLQYGYIVTLQHADGKLSVYKHGASIYKKRGDFVFKGERIGTVSDRGILSTGPHLHFELWEKGVPLNPAIYFPAGIQTSQ